MDDKQRPEKDDAAPERDERIDDLDVDTGEASDVKGGAGGTDWWRKVPEGYEHQHNETLLS